MKASPGLTLLEILVAVTLFAGVAGITTAAVRTGLHVADTARARMNSLERIRTALEIINAQVESAVPATSGVAGSKKSLFRGDRSTLSFPTGVSIWDGSKGNVLVEYRIEPEAGGSWKLVACETVIGTDLRRETTLLKELNEAGFSYAAENEPLRWEQNWGHDLALPKRMRVSVKSRLHQADLVIPIRTGGT